MKDELILYLLRTAEDNIPPGLADCIWMLSKERRRRAERFRHEKDRISSLMTALLARCIISDELGVPAPEILFGRGRYGKPFVKGAEDFHFSVSHTGRTSVFISDGMPIGVDAEEADRDVSDFEGMAERSFSEAELAALEESSDKRQEFLRIWTHKEALVKMKGTGLNVPLKNEDSKSASENIFFRSFFYDNTFITVCGSPAGKSIRI